MSAAKQASAKQAKQAKGTDEEARPEVYNAVKELLESLVSFAAICATDSSGC